MTSCHVSPVSCHVTNTRDHSRFLLYRGHKTACVDSLQWLRGSSSDLAGEFSQLSARLEAALGYRWQHCDT